MPCPSPCITPAFLYCSPPRTLSSVSLSTNYSLFPLFSSSCSLWWRFLYFCPPFAEQDKLLPRHFINPHLLWLAAVLKTGENWALLTMSFLSAFIYLCSLTLFASSSLSFPFLSSGTSFYLTLFWCLVSFWAPCFTYLPISHQHSLKIKVRD